LPICGGFFDVPGAQKRLGEVNALMAAENFWNNREQAQKLIDEANSLRNKTEPLLKAEKQLEDFHVMVELGEAEPEAAQAKIQQELEQDLSRFFKELDSLELKVFLSGRHDKSNCIVSINAGAGGTESCDWANMLLRMYQRWAEARGWKVDVTDILSGETAGIKSATMVLTGENAYGYAKAERGVHRLVRISPFDANKRRHTSFASVDVIAEIEEDDEEIALPPNEREQGGNRRPHHAHSDGAGGGFAKPAFPAPEPRRCDEAPALAHLRPARGRSKGRNGAVLR
jgi:peptide chain release factor 2